MAPIRCCFDQTAVWHSDAARGPSTPSLDHLVDAGEQLGRHFDTECPRRLQVDDELEFGGQLDRHFGWLLALEDAADVDGRLAILVLKIPRTLLWASAGLGSSPFWADLHA